MNRFYDFLLILVLTLLFYLIVIRKKFALHLTFVSYEGILLYECTPIGTTSGIW